MRVGPPCLKQLPSVAHKEHIELLRGGRVQVKKRLKHLILLEQPL